MKQIQHQTKPINHTKKTDDIFLELYDQIADGYKQQFQFTITERNINNHNITKSKHFNLIPKSIATHIINNSNREIQVEFLIGERKFKLIFVLENEQIVYKAYAKAIAAWFYMTRDINKQCSKTLIVYFYFSQLKKTIPLSKTEIIAEEHANTGFTYTCSYNAEIVIYRKEEWFKVLLHESFHNLGMDFSSHKQQNNKILSLFKVDSQVNLFEAYTEMWAEIINVAFCSYFHSKSHNEFLENTEILMNYESTFSLIQMNKVLTHIGVNYEQLLVGGNGYKEKTNVLSYYVIKGVLMNEYQQFLYWCKANNTKLFVFSADINSFYKLIERNSKKRNLFLHPESNDNSLRMSVTECS